jgi:phenylalanyl-tRNA synthetase beta chain
MLFSGLESLAYNLNRQNSDLKFFEFGKTYHQLKKRVEKKHLSLLLTGMENSESWKTASIHADFFYFKGIVESLFTRLGINEFEISSINSSVCAEGFAFKINTKTIVEFGRVAKPILKEFGIEQEVLYADFNWDAVLKQAKKTTFDFQEIPKFPSVRRDFALLVDQSVNFNTISNIAKQVDKKQLKHVNLFDVYEGENLPEGKKSYAVSFTFQDAHKTLTDKQIDKTMAKLLKAFENQIGAVLR